MKQSHRFYGMRPARIEAILEEEAYERGVREADERHAAFLAAQEAAEEAAEEEEARRRRVANIVRAAFGLSEVA